MGVYIKGMKMPISCYDCPIRKRNGMEILCPVCGGTFSVADVNIFFYRLKNCPLGYVPPHGRLIDADAIPYNKIMLEDGDFYYGVTEPYIDRMPTIIEAEDEDV